MEPHHEFHDILITSRHTQEYTKQNTLPHSLGVGALWGLGVGTVIPGLYVGWNAGLAHAGTGGFLWAFAIISVFFAIMVAILSRFSEEMPYAGGPFGFVRKALGRRFGYLEGMLELFALVCVTSALLISLKDYLGLLMGAHLGPLVAIFILAGLIVLHLNGLKVAMMVQLVIVSLAASTVFLYIQALAQVQHVPVVWEVESAVSIARAFPFVIWFFVCIETVTMAAEETRGGDNRISKGLILSFLTIFALVLLMYRASLWVVTHEVLAGFRYPLLELIRHSNFEDPVLYKVFSVLSLTFMIAGLNGLIVGYSRLGFSMSRAGFLPAFLGRLKGFNRVPIHGLLLPSVISVCVMVFGDLNRLIMLANLSVMGVYLMLCLAAWKVGMRHGQKWLVLASALGLMMSAVFLFILMAMGGVLNILVMTGYIGSCAVLYVYGTKKWISVDSPEESAALTEEISILVSEK